MLKVQITEYVGIDPLLSKAVNEWVLKLLSGNFPKDVPEMHPFDTITTLALIEHLPVDVQQENAIACNRFLRQDGILILTTPFPVVDRLFNVMICLQIGDGMSLEEHYRVDVCTVPSIFNNLELVQYEKFQFGLNHLFVFQKTGILAK